MSKQTKKERKKEKKRKEKTLSSTNQYYSYPLRNATQKQPKLHPTNLNINYTVNQPLLKHHSQIQSQKNTPILRTTFIILPAHAAFSSTHPTPHAPTNQDIINRATKTPCRRQANHIRYLLTTSSSSPVSLTDLGYCKVVFIFAFDRDRDSCTTTYVSGYAGFY